MTTWLLSFGWNWLLVPVAIWFLRGVYRAMATPRVKLITFTEVKALYLVDIKRQQLLPPWRCVHETWLVDPYRPSATREGDGRFEDGYEDIFPFASQLARAIAGALRVAQAREEQLTK
jgi:hypothetical protein